MAYIILPHHWQRQPSQPTAINWSHPLARGLIASFDGARRFDNVTNKSWDATTPANLSYESLRDGLFTKSTGSGAYLSRATGESDGSQLTVWLRFRTPGSFTAAYNGLCSIGTTATGGWGDVAVLLYTASGVAGSYSWGSNSTNFTIKALSVNTVYDACVVFDGGPALEYWDGQQHASNSFSGLPTLVSKNHFIGSGYNSSGAATYIGYRVWKRALRADEIWEQYRAPYQIFRPLQRRIWVDLGAGGGPITGTSSGTFSLTGTAAGQVLVAGSSAQSFTLAATGAAAVEVAGSSTAAFDFTGTAEGVVGAAPATGTSVGSFDLSGSGVAEVLISASSAASITLTGTGEAAVEIAGTSSAVFDFTGTGDGVVSASGIPVLSAATVINITTTSATPRVTLTF